MIIIVYSSSHVLKIDFSEVMTGELASEAGTFPKAVVVVRGGRVCGGGRGRGGGGGRGRYQSASLCSTSHRKPLWNS